MVYPLSLLFRRCNKAFSFVIRASVSRSWSISMKTDDLTCTGQCTKPSQSPARALTSLALVGLLAGCAVGPDFKRPEAPTTSKYTVGGSANPPGRSGGQFGMVAQPGVIQTRCTDCIGFTKQSHVSLRKIDTAAGAGASCCASGINALPPSRCEYRCATPTHELQRSRIGRRGT